MKLKFVNSSPSTRSSVIQRCTTQGLMSDRRFKCCTKDKRALIVAQRTCDDEGLDYVSTRDSEDNDDERLD